MKKKSEVIKEKLIKQVFDSLHFKGSSMLWPYRDENGKYCVVSLTYRDVVKMLEWDKETFYD